MKLIASHYAGIDGKTVVVTGGGNGIGLAIAEGFVLHGANVILIDINKESLVVAKERLERKNKDVVIEIFNASVTNEDAILEIFSKCRAIFGRVDVLINNAGVPLNKPSLEIAPSEWRKGIEINLNSVFLCSQIAAQQMANQEGGGTIINVSSMWGVAHSAERTAYCASKAGVVSLTKCLAVEWAKYSIRVNSIGPGYVNTDLVETLRHAGRLDTKELIERTPLARLGEPSEIAELALFLASDSSAFITGQILVADGGWTADGF